MSNNMKVFSGSSNKPLVKEICKHLDKPMGTVYLHNFPSGEKYCQIKENIRGKDVFIVQSFNSHLTPRGKALTVDENIMELLTMVNAARLASARRITAVIPYMAYLRQDRKAKSRSPITARLLANMIEASQVDRVIGLDFHCMQAQGFFNIPVDHLFGIPVFSEEINGDEIDAVVSPDVGGLKRAEVFADEMKKDIVFISKKRTGDEEVRVNGVSGDVSGRRVLIVDDMTESAGTLIEAAKVCHEAGAIHVTCAITHGAFTDKGYEKLTGDHHIDKLIATDSINFDEEKLNSGKMDVKKISVGKLLARAIRATHENESISKLFRHEGF